MSSLARRVARTTLSAWCRVDVTGTEHIPSTGGVILAANHAGHADSIAIGLAARHRLVWFLGDQRLVDEIPIVGRHLETFGMIPLARGAADAEALDEVLAHLAAGKAVAIYPEGSRSRTGAVHRPRSGVARLAAAANVPVVPIGMSGTARLWPIDGNPRVRGGRVHVRIGPPCSPGSDSGRDRRAFNEHLHDELVRLSGAPRVDTFAPVKRTHAIPTERAA